MENGEKFTPIHFKKEAVCVTLDSDIPRDAAIAESQKAYNQIHG
jgi:hypothetical protein